MHKTFLNFKKKLFLERKRKNSYLRIHMPDLAPCDYRLLDTQTGRSLISLLISFIKLYYNFVLFSNNFIVKQVYTIFLQMSIFKNFYFAYFYLLYSAAFFFIISSIFISEDFSAGFTVCEGCCCLTVLGFSALISTFEASTTVSIALSSISCSAL